MAQFTERLISGAFLALNFKLCLIIAVIAGWTFNKNLDVRMITVAYGANVEGRMVASFFLPLVLVASVVGMAANLAGAYHLRVWRTDSLAASVAAVLIAWFLSILAAGVACKEIHIGGRRFKELKLVEGFTITRALLELLWIFLYLYAAVVRRSRESAQTSISKGLPDNSDNGVVLTA